MKSENGPKKQDKYNLMVLNVLKELSKTPKARLSIREIARLLEINPMAVSRSIKELKYILDVKKGSDFETFRLKVYLVRLKDEFKNLEVDDLMKKTMIAKRFDEEVFKR